MTMEISDIRLIKADDRGVVYDCGSMNFVERKQGSVSGNHTHNEDETLYLVKGRVQVQCDDKTAQAAAPVVIRIPKGIFHKVIAMSDVEFLEVPR